MARTSASLDSILGRLTRSLEARAIARRRLHQAEELVGRRRTEVAQADRAVDTHQRELHDALLAEADGNAAGGGS